MSLVNFDINIESNFQLPKMDIQTTNFNFMQIKGYPKFSSANNLFSIYNPSKFTK